jgi:hypothetical protein
MREQTLDINISYKLTVIKTKQKQIKGQRIKRNELPQNETRI